MIIQIALGRFCLLSALLGSLDCLIRALPYSLPVWICMDLQVQICNKIHITDLYGSVITHKYVVACVLQRLLEDCG